MIINTGICLLTVLIFIVQNVVKLKNVMEELTIEQKAKAYDEAIKRARNLYKDAVEMENGMTTKTCEIIFPELKESEDERIRKGLINYFNDFRLPTFGGLEIEKILAWLEKQGNKRADVEQAMKEVEAKAKAFTEAHKGESADEILAEMRGEGWSEEDERKISDVIVAIYAYANGNIPYILPSILLEDVEWLKSLKDRVWPMEEWKHENTGDLTDFENAMMHIGDSFFSKNAGLNPNDTKTIKEQAKLLLELATKQEWSEEDKNFMYDTLSNLTELKDRYGEGYGNVGKCIDWLKSIKERYTWKPSDEQISVCKEVYADLLSAKGFNVCTINSELNRLEEQLKKLREE